MKGIQGALVRYPRFGTYLPGSILFLVLVCTVLLYWNGLSGPMLLDDFPQLIPIFENSELGFQDLYKKFLISESGFLGRPVSMFTFILNVTYFESDLWFWKLTNLIIHLINGIAVYLICFTLLRYSAEGLENPKISWIAIIPASIWLIHPIHVSTVLYTVQRMAQLAAFFSLLGMLIYCKARVAHIAKKSGIWPQASVSIMVCFLLAIFSKESAFLFPGYLLLLEIFVFRMKGFTIEKLWASTESVVLIFSLSMFFYFYFSSDFHSSVLQGFATRDFDMLQRLLTEFRVLMTYIKQIFLPFIGGFGFYHDDFKLSKGLLDPPSTLLSILTVAGMLISAWMIRQRLPLVSCGVFFYFFAHSLESSIFPLEIMYEHRNYLPLAGFSMVLLGIFQAFPHRARGMGVLGGCVILALSWQTFARVQIWSSEQRFYTHAYATHPDSKRVNLVFMQAYLEAGNLGQAKVIAERFADPGFQLVSTYIACKEHGEVTDSMRQKALQLSAGPLESHGVTALIELANLGLSGQCQFPSDWYIELLRTVLARPVKDKDAAKLLLYMAHFYHAESDLVGAIGALEQAFLRKTSWPVPLFLATEWLLDAGQTARARNYFDQAKLAAESHPARFEQFVDDISKRFSRVEPAQ